MKRTLLLLLMIWTNVIFTQTKNYKVVFDNLQSNYNTDKYDEIFNSFSSHMKSALPLEKTKLFFTNLKSQVGNITGKEFINNENGTGAIFKTQFERAVLGVYITLDNQDQIAGLLVKPYEEPVNIKEADLNTLNDYPTKIAEVIFSKVKNLPNNTQLSIAVIQDGKTNYYGIIRDSATIKPIKNQDKIFEIGSITKVFTSTVLASMVVNKKIKLKEEINTFYSFDFKDKIKITFESLANHTSGMPRLPKNLDLINAVNPYKSYGQNKIDEYLENLLILHEVSSKKYTYSNLGAGLLGYTLGKSQKTTFQDLLQKTVFEKYNMQNSYTTSQYLGNQLVKGIDKKGNVVSNWDFDVLFGAGGILSTTEDLVNFVNAQFDRKNKELELTRKPTFNINENLKIGLGWHIVKSRTGSNLYFHNGGTGGYSSSIIVDIENKKSVIILSNVFDINKIVDDLCFKLINGMKQ